MEGWTRDPSHVHVHQRRALCVNKHRWCGRPRHDWGTQDSCYHQGRARARQRQVLVSSVYIRWESIHAPRTRLHGMCNARARGAKVGCGTCFLPLQLPLHLRQGEREGRIGGEYSLSSACTTRLSITSIAALVHNVLPPMWVATCLPSLFLLLPCSSPLPSPPDNTKWTLQVLTCRWT